MLHKIGPLLSFPHTSPAATLRQVMLCGVAFSLHTGKIPQTLVNLLLHGLWLLCMSTAALHDPNQADLCQFVKADMNQFSL